MPGYYLAFLGSLEVVGMRSVGCGHSAVILWLKAIAGMAGIFGLWPLWVVACWFLWLFPLVPHGLLSHNVLKENRLAFSLQINGFLKKDLFERQGYRGRERERERLFGPLAEA